ncbi:glycoside hydrolase family 16 protein [Pedobacter polaris]|uniref:Glycoside hydrolase family 16 protein n=1 Tax=Pedobacter polaris TaxID=2571273 RepID=A0A4U1CR15_9SPHI|nr:glycoside hydrolase family 16 protein [Pedobacter polaris]TKC10481.1 glycoside hydrolase family 16 protein [Pedobacter polaris]
MGRLNNMHIGLLLGLIFVFSCSVPKSIDYQKVADYSTEGYQLVWADEFEQDGVPNPKNWTYEKGFVRNEELQWYQPENAFCKNGILIIEGRKEQKPNPLYVEGSKEWRKTRKNIDYTSACLITKGLQSWEYGRFEMRGKIDVSNGLWPAFWTLGVSGRWPANGEIDIMEYYKGKILANIASMGSNRKPKWFSTTKDVKKLGGSDWAEKFHVWRMDWDRENISLLVDDVLYLKVSLTQLQNEDAEALNPFKQKHYILLNLAMGGLNGGDVEETKFPNRMEVDYVRVYQKN